MQEAEKAFEHITTLQTEIEKLTQELSDRTDYDSNSYNQLIEKLTHANEHLQIIGNGNFYGEIEKTLMGLGFLRSDFELQCAEFRGGRGMRTQTTKILLQCP